MTVTERSVSTSRSSSRRALLAGALGGLGAWAVSAVGRARPVRATDGQALIVGQATTTAALTSLTNSTDNDGVFKAESTGTGTGISGVSDSGRGVFGQSDGDDGIVGRSYAAGKSGVWGNNTAGGYGVSGSSNGAEPKAGVWGSNTGGGYGVVGTTDTGTGVVGSSSGGAGVDGYSSTWMGVIGSSTTSIGVAGYSEATDQPAIRGSALGNSTGVQGRSGGGSAPAPPRTGVYGYANQTSGARGVLGESGLGTGVQGSSNSGPGVWGFSSANYGVFGSSTSAPGVYGFSDTGTGVYGTSTAVDRPANIGHSVGGSTGVQGHSGTTLPAAKAKTGVYGRANQDSSAKGVWGDSPKGRGIQGSSSSGYAGYFSGRVYTTKWYELSEVSAPTAPAVNRARLFIRDNGAGKTQLCVRFSAGAVQVLATQP